MGHGKSTRVRQIQALRDCAGDIAIATDYIRLSKVTDIVLANSAMGLILGDLDQASHLRSSRQQAGVLGGSCSVSGLSEFSRNSAFSSRRQECRSFSTTR